MMMCALYFGVIVLNSNDTHGSRDGNARKARVRKTTIGAWLYVGDAIHCLQYKMTSAPCRGSPAMQSGCSTKSPASHSARRLKENTCGADGPVCPCSVMPTPASQAFQSCNFVKQKARRFARLGQGRPSRVSKKFWMTVTNCSGTSTIRCRATQDASLPNNWSTSYGRKQRRVKLVIFRSYQITGTNPAAPHTKHTRTHTRQHSLNAVC